MEAAGEVIQPPGSLDRSPVRAVQPPGRAVEAPGRAKRPSVRPIQPPGRAAQPPGLDVTELPQHVIITRFVIKINLWRIRRRRRFELTKRSNKAIAGQWYSLASGGCEAPDSSPTIRGLTPPARRSVPLPIAERNDRPTACRTTSGCSETPPADRDDHSWIIPTIDAFCQQAATTSEKATNRWESLPISPNERRRQRLLAARLPAGCPPTLERTCFASRPKNFLAPTPPAHSPVAAAARLA